MKTYTRMEKKYCDEDVISKASGHDDIGVG